MEDLTAMMRSAEAPADLSPSARAVWDELRPRIVIAVEAGSPFETKAREEPERMRRFLVEGFAQCCQIVAAVREARRAKLPLPPLHPLDVELMCKFGLRPHWLLN